MDKAQRDSVLIINGEKDMRDTLFKSLKNDYLVEAAETFEGAMDLMKSKAYNVVVTAIDVPGIKGIEVLHKLKAVKSEVPIVVITAHTSVPLAVEAMKAGAYDYITRPFNLDELRLVIYHAAEWQRLVEEVKEKRVFQELALLDGLTHIYNRRYFEELLRREVERSARYPQKFSLLMTDIDDFKKYNDTYGHVAGDELLKKVSGLLVHMCRTTDFVTRYGGEEFAIIAPHTDKKASSFLATRIVHTMSNEPMIIDGAAKAHITISVGVATYGDDATQRDELIKRADEALYQAKRLGKNRVCLYGIE